MRLLDTDTEQTMLKLKHCTITVCCLFVIGTGIFVFIPSGDWIIGSLHLFFGSAGTVTCMYEFLIYPYMKIKGRSSKI